MKVERTDIRLYADVKKVLLRYLDFGLNPDRINPIVEYVLSLDQDQIDLELKKIYADFGDRHFDLKGQFLNNFSRINSMVSQALSESQKMLLGSYFTHEYSIQASALFNPSIVAHPDQSGVEEGGLKFIMSLRATGEGHISSVAFCSGEIDESGKVILHQMENKLTSGKVDIKGDAYTVDFDPKTAISSRVLFPQLPSERMGMEDVRFVEIEDEGSYVGTYTAYSGTDIRPQLIVTEDFQRFEIGGLKGTMATNKGLALFPRKVNGRYAMIGRQGGRSLSIMFSDSLYEWNDSAPLQIPQRGWEMLQIGNNGSPIETEAGWLLLTHGVGPMRKYTLSMSLLDLEDPSKVIASLDQPLLSPNEEEREGYVPNVLYTCGMIVHAGTLFIPYAMSDSAISFAKVSIQDVLNELTK
ncbi:glycoside hydrolase family 130 protein [Portibacter lacus]|uniref:Glycosidase n=1 Tax=Portibacter lacus TaxID=1099794 RepID=A0AA37SP71_9BACT|nr:glycoside hydrolase family 130 protein [Portibacter lacus]GLR17134.1 glycosidase [Portibacter lacus]